MLASSPGFQLDTEMKVFDGKSEAEFLAQSIADVARHYNPAIFEQKTIDWSNLIQCAALIYGPRIYNIRHDRRAAKAQSVQPKPAFQYGPPPVDPQPRADRAMNGASVHKTPMPANDYVLSDKEVRTGTVAGIGDIELPADWLGKPN